MQSLVESEKSLLVLPQDEVMPAAATNKKGNFVLVQLPDMERLWTKQEPQDKESSYLLASNQSSAVVVGDKSFSICTVGSSNTFILVPPSPSDASNDADDADKEDANDNNHNTINTATSNNKRSKPNPPIRPTRLVKPGGSGAFFLEATDHHHKLNSDQIRALLLQQENQQGLSVTELSHRLQYAPAEIEKVLKTMPVVCNGNKKYSLLPEDVLLQGQRAVLETLCEVCPDHATNGGVISNLNECVTGIVERLDLDDLDDLDDKSYNKMAVARTCLELIRRVEEEDDATTETQDGTSSMHLNRDKVSIKHINTDHLFKMIFIFDSNLIFRFYCIVICRLCNGSPSTCLPVSRPTPNATLSRRGNRIFRALWMMAFMMQIFRRIC